METVYRAEAGATTVNEATTGEQWAFNGFTQVENAVLRDSANLSPMARLTYTMLRSYGWQDQVCWPGMKRLCEDVGHGETKVREYLKELENAGLILKKRRGLNRSNVYRFTRPLVADDTQKPATISEENTGFSPEPQKCEGPEPQTSEDKEHSGKEYPIPSGGDAHGGSDPRATAKDQTTKLIRAIEDTGGHVTSEQRNRFGGGYKHLLNSENVTVEELERIIAHIARQWSRIALSVDQAFGDVRSGRDRAQKNGNATANVTSGATPTEAIEAIEAREDLAQFAQLAREWDFRSELWPDYKVLQKLGSDNMEMQDTLRRLHKVSSKAAGGVRDAGENAATPAAGIEAIRAHERFAWFVGVAAEHDFSGDAEPSIRTLCNLGANDPEESRRNFKSMKSVVRRAVSAETEVPLTEEEHDTLRKEFENKVEDPPNEFLMYWDGGTSMLATELAASTLGRSATQNLDNAVREILDGIKSAKEVAA